MTRATTKGGSTLSPWAFVAFVGGVGIGLGLVAPVLPATFGTAYADIVQAGGTIVLAGVLAFALLMVMLAILYQGYLKA